MSSREVNEAGDSIPFDPVCLTKTNSAPVETSPGGRDWGPLGETTLMGVPDVWLSLSPCMAAVQFGPLEQTEPCVHDSAALYFPALGMAISITACLRKGPGIAPSQLSNVQP